MLENVNAVWKQPAGGFGPNGSPQSGRLIAGEKPLLWLPCVCMLLPPQVLWASGYGVLAKIWGRLTDGNVNVYFRINFQSSFLLVKTHSETASWRAFGRDLAALRPSMAGETCLFEVNQF